MTATSAQTTDSSTGGAPRIAYLVSRFPKLTETFVLYELLEVAKSGADVSLYPLWRERTGVCHREVDQVWDRVHFEPTCSGAIAWSNLAYFARRPWHYLATWATALKSCWGSRRYLLGILAIFPKTVHNGRRMRAAGVSHVHAHFASHPAAAAWIIGRLFEIPYSFTAHGSDLHRDQHMLPLKTRDAEFVIAISEYNRRFILDRCGGERGSRVHVLHCGVDLDRFRPGPDDDSSARPMRVICVGTLHEVKGQKYLLEAAARLRNSGVPIELHLVGDGPETADRKRQAASLGIENSVIFHGRKTSDDIAELVRRSDVVVAPSVPTKDGRREGIPVALMEAMACGRPVVASRLSGIPELVEDGVSGLLVPPGDVDGLVAALSRLHAAPELCRRFGAAGRAIVEQRFNLRTNALLLADLLLKRPKDPTPVADPFPSDCTRSVEVEA